MELVFKVKRTEGVGVKPNNQFLKYIGKSRLDGFPVFRLTYEQGFNAWKLAQDNLIVNMKPNYIIQKHETEVIRSVEDEFYNPSIASDLIPVLPMDLPSGTLFYMDHIYDSLDERLLLML
jgi:hypothetical protein